MGAVGEGVENNMDMSNTEGDLVEETGVVIIVFELLWRLCKLKMSIKKETKKYGRFMRTYKVVIAISILVL